MLSQGLSYGMLDVVYCSLFGGVFFNYEKSKQVEFLCQAETTHIP